MVGEVHTNPFPGLDEVLDRQLCFRNYRPNTIKVYKGYMRLFIDNYSSKTTEIYTHVSEENLGNHQPFGHSCKTDTNKIKRQNLSRFIGMAFIIPIWKHKRILLLK
jgi:hypothetical protein